MIGVGQPLQQPVLAPPVPPPPPIIYRKKNIECIVYSVTNIMLIGSVLRFDTINASILQLNDDQDPTRKGFRNFVRLRAEQLGITGNIMRTPNVHARVVLYGTMEMLQNFDEFINEMGHLGMIEACNELEGLSVSHRPPNCFKVLKSTSSHARRGPYSEEEYDGSTHYSADNNHY